VKFFNLKWGIKICIYLLLGVLSLDASGQTTPLNVTFQQFENKENATLKYHAIQQLISENAAKGIELFNSHQKAFSTYPDIYAKAMIVAAEGHYELAQYSMAHTLVDSAQIITKDSTISYEALYTKGRLFYKEKSVLTAFNIFNKCKPYFQKNNPEFLKKTNSYLVGSLIMLSRLYQELNQDSFFLLLSKAEKIVCQPSYTDSINKVNVLYTLGAHYARTYDTISAFQYFDKVSQIKVDFETLLSQNIAFEKGLVYGKLGLFDAALQQHKISLKIATEIKNNHSIYSNTMSLGRLFFDIGAYEKTAVYYQQGHDLAKKINNDYLFSIALTNMGQLHLKTRNFEKAITYFESSMSANDSLNNKSGIISNNLGIAMAKTEQQLFSEAYRYTQSAYIMAKALGFKAQLANSTSLFARIALELKDYPTAIQKSKEVLTLQSDISQLELVAAYKNNRKPVFKSRKTTTSDYNKTKNLVSSCSRQWFTNVSCNHLDFSSKK